MTNTSPGALLAAVAQDGGRHRGEEADSPHAAVAAGPPAGAAGTHPNLKGLHAHRKPELQYFGVRETGVGHMGLYHARACETWTRAGPACDRFIVLVAGVAEGEV